MHTFQKPLVVDVDKPDLYFTEVWYRNYYVENWDERSTHMCTDGVCQDSVPVVDDAVDLWLDQQLCPLMGLQLNDVLLAGLILRGPINWPPSEIHSEFRLRLVTPKLLQGSQHSDNQIRWELVFQLKDSNSGKSFMSTFPTVIITSCIKNNKSSVRLQVSYSYTWVIKC